jgi:spermidine synthase
VGAIGLGVGTVAAFGRPGDRYTFYEINPLVIELARRDFTYLRDSAAEIHIHEGDARLELESEPTQNFDVLVADAFSGDAIPVHLLTREALGLYFRHLRPEGVLAVHISNTYLNLRPVVARAAQDHGRQAVVVTTRADEVEGTFRSSWVLVSANREILESPPIRSVAVPLAPFPEFRPWTDDYSSLLGILKWVPE